MKKQINSFEAYVSMYEFLGELYDQEDDDDLGAILGSMMINRNDGNPMDPAMKSIWVATVSNRFPNQKTFDLKESYSLLIDFLTSMERSGMFPAQLLQQLKDEKTSEITLPNWEQIVDMVIFKYR